MEKYLKALKFPYIRAVAGLRKILARNTSVHDFFVARFRSFLDPQGGVNYDFKKTLPDSF
jgi:hypothetical protein